MEALLAFLAVPGLRFRALLRTAIVVRAAAVPALGLLSVRGRGGVSLAFFLTLNTVFRFLVNLAVLGVCGGLLVCLRGVNAMLLLLLLEFSFPPV